MNAINFKDVENVAIENFYKVVYINFKEGKGGCESREFEDEKSFKKFKKELKAHGIKQQKKSGGFFSTELEEIKI